MPQSDVYNIPWIIQLLNQIEPTSVLDIGIGNGTYGFLVRQSLDIAKGRLKKTDWLIQIDGVEVFEDYKNPIWEYFYDKVAVGNIFDIEGKIVHYDVILLSDVIEHFSKEEGLVLINSLIKKTDFLIISTPKNEYPQGEIFGNQFETHLSEWKLEDFSNYHNQMLFINQCFIVVLCQDKSNLYSIDFSCFPRLTRTRRSIRGILKNTISNFIVDIRQYLKLKR
jgi:hypothetical protein